MELSNDVNERYRELQNNLVDIRAYCRRPAKERVLQFIENATVQVDSLLEEHRAKISGTGSTDELRLIYLKIVEQGLRNIRVLSLEEEWDQCFFEADHLHNIPMLLEDLHIGKRNHYICAEITSYLNINCSHASYFLPLWARLRKFETFALEVTIPKHRLDPGKC